MRYQVYLSIDAEDDIVDIWSYVAGADSPAKADRLVDDIQKTMLALSEFPERGHLPPELERIHIRTFREIHWKPYRIIYRIEQDRVLVHCVLDGRRNLQDLLFERSIRPPR